ncbi:MAG: hypothetical protein Q8Q76_05480 [Methylotenera sp.]|nr:hypothetical protein [Methylotenera sp.]
MQRYLVFGRCTSCAKQRLRDVCKSNAGMLIVATAGSLPLMEKLINIPDIGFDIELIVAWLDLNRKLDGNLENCSKENKPCP